MILQYRQLIHGEQIVVGADPAEGGDYSAWVAVSKNSADVVMVGKSKFESSQLGYELDHIGRFIQNQTGNLPCIAVEKNTGSATLYVLKTLNYSNLFRMPSSFTAIEEKDQDNYGWVTSTATRPKMLDDLAVAIRTKAICIPSKEIVDELFTFVRHHKTGKPIADVGSHDDLLMALAIAWQLYQVVPAIGNDGEIELPDESSPFISLPKES